MNYNDAEKLIDELNDYLRLSVGIGKQYGLLGHVTGGVLSHQVLHNDPLCQELNEDGTVVECQLNEKDKHSVLYVYQSLLNIINDGRSNKFCERLELLKQYIKAINIVNR